jgi:hypothetical protein
MERVIDQCVAILDDHMDHIENLLQLNYEVGGTVKLHDKSFKVTLKGELDHPSIFNAEIHPFRSEDKIIDWHTHYNDIPNIDQLPPGAPRAIPSDTDIISVIRGSVWHKHPCVSVVVSRWGYFFMTVPTRMIRCLGKHSHKEVEEICDHKIREKIGKGAYQFFYDHAEEPLEDRVEKYIQCVEKIYNTSDKDYGLYCRMVFRDLSPKPVACVVM